MSYNWEQLLRSYEEQAFARVDPFTSAFGRTLALTKYISGFCEVFRDWLMVFETQHQLYFQH